MADPSSSSCGIGTPGDQTGACTGTYFPSDAGQGVFSGVSASPVVAALAGAGGLLVALLLAVFLSRVVGGFFGGGSKVGSSDRSRKFSAVVEEFMREHPESDSFSSVVQDHMRERSDGAGRGDANDLDRADDEEVDREDDTEEGQDEADWRTDSPGYRNKFQ